MAQVVASTLSGESRLHDYVAASDFLDCYSVAADMSPRRAAEIITEFPVWAQWLLKVRRILTSPFGLSQDGPAMSDKVGPFPVVFEAETELIAGFDDKHLNFRVSVHSTNGRVSLATWVHPHNFGGWLYLRTILPFHVMIARDALRRVARIGIVA